MLERAIGRGRALVGRLSSVFTARPLAAKPRYIELPQSVYSINAGLP